jgi:hypothetical protein
MSHYLAQIIIVASNSDGEDTFWTQMLVLVILAALFGIGSFVKTRSGKLKRLKRDYPGGGPDGRQGWPKKTLAALREKSFGVSFKTLQPKAVSQESASDFNASGPTSRARSKTGFASERDMHSGMELLELDFLVGTLAKTKSYDCNDVMVRKLSFKELLRRGELRAADSNTLKDYALNEDNIYGKDIQCEAIKELAKRTRTKTRPAAQVRELVTV